jgi:hypothetical protein
MGSFVSSLAASIYSTQLRRLCIILMLATRLHPKFYGSTLPWGCRQPAGNITEETHKGHVATREEGTLSLIGGVDYPWCLPLILARNWASYHAATFTCNALTPAWAIQRIRHKWFQQHVKHCVPGPTISRILFGIRKRHTAREGVYNWTYLYNTIRKAQTA